MPPTYPRIRITAGRAGIVRIEEARPAAQVSGAVIAGETVMRRVLAG
jgi:hypothetical protein